MKKNILLFLSILILFTGAAGACASWEKTSKRVTRGSSTRTPILPKATFTNTPAKLAGGEVHNNPSPDPEKESPAPAKASQPGTTPQLSPSPPWTATSTAIPPSTTSPPPATETSPPTAKPPTQTRANPSKTTAATATVEKDTPRPSPTSIPPSATATPQPPTATSAPTATPQPEECTYSGNATYENQVVDLINKERKDRGLPALSQHSSLRQAARRHSQDMACNDHFSHTGTDGSTLGSRLLDAGYSYSWAAENIGASSSQSFSAQSVVTMWMNSPGHRKNILSENAKHIGVGFRYVDDSDSGDYDAYYTADFARP